MLFSEYLLMCEGERTEVRSLRRWIIAQVKDRTTELARNYNLKMSVEPVAAGFSGRYPKKVNVSIELVPLYGGDTGPRITGNGGMTRDNKTLVLGFRILAKDISPLGIRRVLNALGSKVSNALGHELWHFRHPSDPSEYTQPPGERGSWDQRKAVKYFTQPDELGAYGAGLRMQARFERQPDTAVVTQRQLDAVHDLLWPDLGDNSEKVRDQVSDKWRKAFKQRFGRYRPGE